MSGSGTTATPTGSGRSTKRERDLRGLPAVLFAREILSRKPGAAIISEVKSSQNLYDDIARHGGRPVMWKAGHSLIKAKMKEEYAELAGEMSGHVFFRDRYLGSTTPSTPPRGCSRSSRRNGAR